MCPRSERPPVDVDPPRDRGSAGDVDSKSEQRGLSDARDRRRHRELERGDPITATARRPGEPCPRPTPWRSCKRWHCHEHYRSGDSPGRMHINSRLARPFGRRTGRRNRGRGMGAYGFERRLPFLATPSRSAYSALVSEMMLKSHAAHAQPTANAMIITWARTRASSSRFPRGEASSQLEELAVGERVAPTRSRSAVRKARASAAVGLKATV